MNTFIIAVCIVAFLFLFGPLFWKAFKVVVKVKFSMFIVRLVIILVVGIVFYLYYSSSIA